MAPLTPSELLIDSWERRLALAACISSLGIAVLLALSYGSLGGPGDQLDHYRQASQLIPFTHNFYGPGYFVALRLVRVLTGLEWFATGKLVSLLAMIAALVGSWRLAVRVCPGDERWMALTLLALNPIFIGQGYASYNIMLAYAAILPAILVLTRTPDMRSCVLAGLLFGLAGLVRFQSLGFMLGAMVGLWFTSGSMGRRVSLIFALAVAGAAPSLAWRGFLLAVQGFVPANYNFVNLTIALGRLESFQEVNDLITEYGSMLGVVLSSPTAPLRIFLFGAKRLALFPFREGLGLFFLPAGLLAAGGLTSRSLDRLKQPWFLAFLSALFLTGLGSKGWEQYYIPVLLWCAILISSAVVTLTPGHRRVIWSAILAVYLPWAGWKITQDFRERNWTEWDVARRYVARNSTPATIVSSTASSLTYGIHIQFRDQSDLMLDRDSDSLVPILRRQKINKLVVSERHTLFEFPSLAPLLEAGGERRWPGLKLDTLITTPRRLAIYSVEP